MSDKAVSIEALIELIEDSTDEIRVVVPDTDYYARRGDTTTEYLRVINPRKLVDALQAMKDHHDHP